MDSSGIDRQAFVPPLERQPPPHRSRVPVALAALMVIVAGLLFYLYQAGGTSLLPPAGKQEDAALTQRIAELEKRLDALEKGRPTGRQPRRSATESESRAGNGQQSSPPVTAVRPPATRTSASTTQSPAIPAGAPERTTPAPPPPVSNGADGAEEQRWKATVERMGSVVGELGSQRREIARTHDELASLAERLERRSIPFALPRNVRRQVGPVYVRLESVDIKDQHYTIRLLNGDTATVLKDRAVNEVVRLYQDEGSAPLELIVTHLNANQATGTLILPAVETAPAR